MGKGGRETSVASRIPPSGNLACSPGMCPYPEPKWRRFSLQEQHATN